MIGTIERKIPDPDDVDSMGIIRGDHGERFYFTARELVRNGTGGERVDVGKVVHFGGLQARPLGVATWVSWAPVDDKSADSMHRFAVRHRRLPNAGD